VVLRWTKPSGEGLARLLANAKAADPSYSEVGATSNSSLPAGYRLDHYERQLGSDENVFERAVEALRGWKAHAGAGVEVVPGDARVTVGATVLLLIKAAGLWAVAPFRVVYVVDEPDRFGFAYGTLAGHPERGEVAMIVERHHRDGVVFRIVSFSRTVDPVARFGAAVTRLFQRRVSDRYVAALAIARER
jgi:uncharacterized protein (UPF0548 family)